MADEQEYDSDETSSHGRQTAESKRRKTDKSQNTAEGKLYHQVLTAVSKLYCQVFSCVLLTVLA